MKTSFLIKRCSIISLVLILFLCVFSGNVNGESLFSSIDEMACSDVVVKAFTTCPSDNKVISLSECTEQHFVFSNKRTGKSTEVKCHGETAAHFGPDGRSLGNYLDALAYSWACVEGMSGRYLLVLYTTGGTCDGCEWAEIYSLQGGRLAANKIQSKKKDAKTYNPLEKFKETYKRLGLPEPWPRDAFKDIKLFRADR